MSLESSRPISTTHTAIKATQQSLEALSSKQPRLWSSNPGGAWLLTMFMESRKPEQKTFPPSSSPLSWADYKFRNSSNRCSDRQQAVFYTSVRKTFLADEELDSNHIWIFKQAAVSGSLSHTACIKCSPIGCWPHCDSLVSLETGCPPLHSCPSPNEILVQSLTLLPCSQEGKVMALVPWRHTD